MLSFDVYCDIRNGLHREAILGKTSVFERIVEEQDDESAVRTLISSCDRKTVLGLIRYFDADAPVQNLLQNRLRKLGTAGDEGALEEYVKQRRRSSGSFYQYLAKLIDEKGFQSDAKFYTSIGMSRQTFAKIRKSGNGISRNHALLMAAGLGLDYGEAVDFMSNAGYAFRKGDMRESIICYVMRNYHYDLIMMEEILVGFGEKPLMDYGEMSPKM